MLAWGVRGRGFESRHPDEKCARLGSTQSGFFMEYFVFILYSQKNDRYYVGQTQNLEERLERHNIGRNKSTKSGIPWSLVHYEVVTDRSAALAKERYIKNLGSKRYLNMITKDFDKDLSDSLS